jgi:hypothetical protein
LFNNCKVKFIKINYIEREREKAIVVKEKQELRDQIQSLKSEMSEMRDKEYELTMKWKQLRIDNGDLIEVFSGL